MDNNIYVSLDEAREELKKRWNNVELKKKVEDELGDKFWPEFKLKPHSVMTRQICVADNGFELFFYSGKYINVDPLVIEFSGDIFVRCNEEKKGVGRLRVVLENKKKALVDIFNLDNNEKKKFNEIITKSGDNLVEFHHKLFDIIGHEIDINDKTEWFKDIGKASDYYYYYLLHFVAHGVLFDVFQTEEDDSEDVFTRNVVLPALEKIKQKFNVKPLVIRLYPSKQNAEEDFYWWCFPPNINDYIVKYANKHEFVFKNYNTK
jgi:hypothetical protein